MDSKQLAGKYLGEAAKSYDAQRTGLAKWQREQDAVEQLLAQVPHGASLLDVPVGTGRFFPYFLLPAITEVAGIQTLARHAGGGACQGRPRPGLAAELAEGSIFALPFPAGHFDAVVSIRMLNWFEAADMARAVAELARVSKRHVALSIRTLVEDMAYGPAAGSRGRTDVAALIRIRPRPGLHHGSPQAPISPQRWRPRGSRPVSEIHVKSGRKDTVYVFLLAEKEP